jgi:hypothetical protein
MPLHRRRRDDLQRHGLSVENVLILDGGEVGPNKARALHNRLLPLTAAYW